MFKKSLLFICFYVFSLGAYALENKTLEDKNSSYTDEFSFAPKATKISNIKDNKSLIELSNLKIGQTGIVVHLYDDEKKIIVANAKVIKSDDKSSTVEFFDFEDLKQDAIPTTKRKVQNGDILIMNYMYDKALLIAPNFSSYKSIIDAYPQSHFIHPDIFAASLKFENKPFPKKEDFQKFAIEQNLGTIFFLLANKLFILDSKSFATLKVQDFAYTSQEEQMPFFTRIEDIKSGLFDFSGFFSDKKISYEEYYKNILGKNDAR